MKIRLGTRGSKLARTQSGWVADQVRQAGHEVETLIVETRGDQQRDRAFAAIGQPGVFVRELERALEERRVDLVVHSYKDLPSESPTGLVVAAVPERLDSADRLIALPNAVDSESESLLPLVEGSRVGTASARRQALVKHLRPDLEVALLRGNVPTRLEKLRSGEHDAILLAAAGLERLDRAETVTRDGLHEFRLDPQIFVPAPSQGALALQVRRPELASGENAELDQQIHRIIESLTDAAVLAEVSAERELLRKVEGGCNIPFGAWCRWEAGELHLESVLGLADGRLLRASGQGTNPLTLAARVATSLLGPGETPS